MSKRRKLRTWADEIADLEDPTPKGEEGSSLAPIFMNLTISRL